MPRRGAVSYKCEQCRRCLQLLAHLGLPYQSELFKHRADICFCERCVRLRGGVQHCEERGPFKYEIPIGFCGVGLALRPGVATLGIWD